MRARRCDVRSHPSLAPACALRLAAKRAELEMAEASQSEVPTKRHMHRAEADRQRRLMERLIHSRRPEAVARLETERGLA